MGSRVKEFAPIADLNPLTAPATLELRNRLNLGSQGAGVGHRAEITHHSDRWRSGLAATALAASESGLKTHQMWLFLRPSSPLPVKQKINYNSNSVVIFLLLL